jgi:hypothetical protein
MDTYGYLYQDTFDPVDPSRNLIAKNNAGCNNGHFWLHGDLLANITYILVVTTNASNVKGAFSVVSTGVANVHFSPIGEYDYSIIHGCP